MTPAANRRGFTLVEMLVAMTATLVLMAAVAQAFAMVGTAFTNSRALLELDARMRTTAWTLREDLSRATASTLPLRTGAAADGYLEIIEGPQTDASSTAGADVGPADCDDVLAFTVARGNESLAKLRYRPSFTPWAPTSNSVRAVGENFSPASHEVVWFLRPQVDATGTAVTNPARFVLCRRGLRLRNYLQEMRVEPVYYPSQYNYNSTLVPTSKNVSTFIPDNRRSTGSVTTAINAWWDSPQTGSSGAGVGINPVYSLRRTGTWLYPNSLADLRRRESRVVHNLTGTITTGTALDAAFPFVMQDSGTFLAPAVSLRNVYADIAVVMSDVLAFDVRVFDPTAPVAVAAGGTPLVPGDPGFAAAGAAVASGGYVNLGHGVTANPLLVSKGVDSWFGNTPDAKSRLNTADPTRRTYDTWSWQYENNGRNEDGDALVDEGTNALDDDGDGSVDEADEQETSPPYPVPLRAIEIRLRCYEPTSRQVRQVTIRHAFMP